MKQTINKQVLYANLQRHSSLLTFLLLIVIISFLSPNFLTIRNLLNVLRQSSTNGLIAFGMTLVILTAGIDLSVGSILAFSCSITALLLQTNIAPFLALIIGLMIGILVGTCNGMLIAYANLQPFIVTLSTMTIFRGLTFVFTKGRPISIANSSGLFESIGTGYLLGIPIPVYILFFFCVILWVVLHKTVLGRSIYAIGGNEKASYIVGIKTRSVKIIVYASSGLFSTLAGMILMSRLSSSQPNLGVGFELEAIAAVVIGGTTLSGGRGKILGTLIGILVIAVLNNSLNLLGVSSFYQQVVKGLVILMAVLFDLRKK